MTPTSTPRPQISPGWPVFYDWWVVPADPGWGGCRAGICTTVRDRDGNPEGRDGATGSVRSMTARSEGVAQ